jgi:two-component system sensor histidine kinase/response regulator
MPGMDGYTATSIIRQDDRFATLPILAMTANVMAEDRVRAQEEGMNGHVPKPVDPRQLYRALLEAIPAGDYSVNLIGVQADSKSNTPAAPKKFLPLELPGLDITLGLGRLAGNEQLMIKLLQEFIADYSDYHKTIGQLVAAGDREEARELAHKLRGIANNLGATEVGHCAEAIERNVLDGIEVTTEQVDRLGQALALVSTSRPLLLAAMMPDAESAVSGRVDVEKIFGELIQAVTASDPGAIDLIDQLLAGEEAGSDLAQKLAEPRALLDNFNFADAGPLLAQAGETLLI